MLSLELVFLILVSVAVSHGRTTARFPQDCNKRQPDFEIDGWFQALGKFTCPESQNLPYKAQSQIEHGFLSFKNINDNEVQNEESDEIFWPKRSRIYHWFKSGPCAYGEWLVTKNGIPFCLHVSPGIIKKMLEVD